MIELAHVKEIKFSGNEAKYCGRHRKYLLCFFHFSARSDERLCVRVVYFSLPHVCRKLWGKPQGSITGTAGTSMHLQQGKGFKGHFRFISEPDGSSRLLASCTWAGLTVLSTIPVLIISDGTFYVTLNVFLVYVTGPRANTKGHVINLCVNLTCSTLTRDTNLKHKYTNPTTSSSSFVFLIYIGIQIHRSFWFLWF